jgi:homoserine dehydrogenase
VRAAHEQGRPFRLVARARRDGDGRVNASVRPEQVEPRGPFGTASGTTLAIHYELDVLPGLTVVAHDPDLKSTAYGLLADFITAVRDEAR